MTMLSGLSATEDADTLTTVLGEIPGGTLLKD